MKQQDLAKIRWNDNTINLYTKVMKEEITPNIRKQQLRTIVKKMQASYHLQFRIDYVRTIH